MRKSIMTLLIVAIASTAFGQETRDQRRYRRGQAPGYATRDATALSMMGWGLGIAIGIATLCALIENNPASTSSSTSH
ncbi:MAG: hypothetical protein KGQ49_04470 [Verrucomicrobia bacterium]|nr:hypothetical protein [Verrucomicrobiota bacterium]MBU6446632.1 hypothetical protein [Verrucomicrobiota bacterium]MDE3047050.1 hypothetical protein [Verrucomicrobiota bacterium]